jgi:hypothetical protein
MEIEPRWTAQLRKQSESFPHFPDVQLEKAGAHFSGIINNRGVPRIRPTTPPWDEYSSNVV